MSDNNTMKMLREIGIYPEMLRDGDIVVLKDKSEVRVVKSEGKTLVENH